MTHFAVLPHPARADIRWSGASEKVCFFVLTSVITVSPIAFGQHEEHGLAQLAANAESVVRGHVITSRRISPDRASTRLFDVEVMVDKTELGVRFPASGKPAHFLTSRPVLSDTDYVFLIRSETQQRKKTISLAEFQIRPLLSDRGEAGVVMDANHYAFVPPDTVFKTIGLRHYPASTDQVSPPSSDTWILNSLISYPDFIALMKAHRAKL